MGTFVSADGSTFYGSWQAGHMHGEGVYKPAASRNARAEVVFLRQYDEGRLVQEQVGDWEGGVLGCWGEGRGVVAAVMGQVDDGGLVQQQVGQRGGVVM